MVDRNGEDDDQVGVLCLVKNWKKDEGFRQRLEIVSLSDGVLQGRFGHVERKSVEPSETWQLLEKEAEIEILKRVWSR